MQKQLGQHAVIGHPVAHSLSPRIQRAFAAQFDAAIDYTTIDVTAADFVAAARLFFAGGGVGVNVTVPHKHAAFDVAERHAPSARAAGVANVLMPCAAGIEAHNTDGSGFVRDLNDYRGFDPHGSRVLLLGAGGAAYGLGFALRDAGVDQLVVANRTAARAAQLAQRLGAPAIAHPWPGLAHDDHFDLIVNATAAGLHGSALDLPPAWAGDALCYDLAYGAAAAPFVAWASASGAPAVDGLGMLIETAADSFALWHGKRPATAALRAELNPSP